MKSIQEINFAIESLSKSFGVNFSEAQQGSLGWHQLKLGVLSSSNAYKIVAKQDSDTRWTYLYELVAQIASGVIEEINSKYLEFGKAHEDAARANYEFLTDEQITPVAFIFKDESFRTGCSPDGIISEKKGLELKVPFNVVQYVKFLCEEKIKSEYVHQCQFSMWVTGADEWDYCNFAPLMKVHPMKIVTLKRDHEKMMLYDDLVPKFISDLDDELKKVGLRFGAQWERLRENAP